MVQFQSFRFVPWAMHPTDDLGEGVGLVVKSQCTSHIKTPGMHVRMRILLEGLIRDVHWLLTTNS